MTEMGSLRLAGQDARRHANAGAFQNPRGGSFSARIGIVDGVDNAANACRDDRTRAWRRVPMMAAGLQCHIKRRPFRTRARIAQGFGFRMGAPARLCPSARQYSPILDDERADGWVWRAKPIPPPADRQGRGHEPGVVINLAHAWLGERLLAGGGFAGSSGA